MSKLLSIGKLPSGLLRQLIKQLPSFDDSVIIPPGIGLDAAGLRVRQPLISVTTDPVTFSTHELGEYSLCVNINDIACTGSKPRWYTATLLLPVGTTEEMVLGIWKNLINALEKYQIQAVGGHIEITDSVKTPVLVGQMIGELSAPEFLSPENGQPGDQILLCQPIAIEGTALLSKQKAAFLEKYLSPEALKNCQSLLEKPGICVWPWVEPLLQIPGLIALHDPTEGGVATALHEWADATQCGLLIDEESILVRPETLAICDVFAINPLGLLASGSLLILCRPEAQMLIKSKLPPNSTVRIGQLTQTQDRSLERNRTLTPLPRFDSDEIVKALGMPN